MRRQHSNIARLFNHLIWTFGEQVMSIGMPRLLLFPVAALLIGKQEFGIFVTAQSVILIIGLQPSNGLSTGLLRHLSAYSESQQLQYCRAALHMSHIAMIILIGVGLACLATLGLYEIVARDIVKCLIPLLLSLYPENQFALILTELRIKRHFKRRTLWYGLRAIALVTFAIIGAFSGTALGLAWGYLVGSSLAYAILLTSRRKWLSKIYDKKMGQSLKRVWLHMTIAGIIVLSGPYLNRIILSVWHTYSDVADLFAATSVVYLFMAPVTSGGGLLLSLLARYNSIDAFTNRARKQFFVAIIVALVALPIFIKILGPLIVSLLFPAFGSNPRKLFEIAAWIAPGLVLISFTRPFVVKFAPVHVTPIINGFGLVALLLPAILLVPQFGATGAAWAMVIGAAVPGLLWCAAAAGVLLHVPIFHIKTVHYSASS